MGDVCAAVTGPGPVMVLACAESTAEIQSGDDPKVMIRIRRSDELALIRHSFR
jgi:hypothetical protein